MNALSYVVLEVKKNDNKFSFSMPMGAPLGEAYDACFEVLRDIVELSKQAVTSAERKEKEQETI